VSSALSSDRVSSNVGLGQAIPSRPHVETILKFRVSILVLFKKY
jgi:hypothetical protein